MVDSGCGVVATVIVPTRNRCALVRELLESLFLQSLDPHSFEIIVVDNQSTDDTAAMIASLQATAPCRLSFVVMKENRGPIHSRNTAARMAQGEILAFTDSDCRVTPQWLEKGLQPFQTSPEIAFVSGAVLDKPEQPGAFFSLRNGAVPGEENFTYPACNILFRKSVFLELGGFDEAEYHRDVGDKPIECADTDLAWRIVKKGYGHVYRDDLIVYHDVTVLRPWPWLKAHSRLVAVPRAVRLHPELRDKICWRGPFFRLQNLLFYAAVAGLLASFASAWFALLTLPYLFDAFRDPGHRFTLSRIPRLLGRFPFLVLRQAVICGSLLWSSVRVRTLVL